MSRKKISQNELFYSLETIKTKKSDIFTKTKTFGRELTALDAI
jgi:DNA-binding CsgD family transcriptional regulator